MAYNVKCTLQGLEDNKFSILGLEHIDQYSCVNDQNFLSIYYKWF